MTALKVMVFLSKIFIKPNATNCLFLDGQLYHSFPVFKSIAYSEAIGMRRLNEANDKYLHSVQQLTGLKSSFNLALVDKIF